MKKKIVAMILTGCMLVGNAQAAFAEEAFTEEEAVFAVETFPEEQVVFAEESFAEDEVIFVEEPLAESEMVFAEEPAAEEESVSSEEIMPAEEEMLVEADTYDVFDIETEYGADAEDMQSDTVESRTVVYTFLVNGAPYAVQTVMNGDELRKPEDPVLEGYIFEGWFIGENPLFVTDADGDGAADPEIVSVSEESADVTVTAVFREAEEESGFEEEQAAEDTEEKEFEEEELIPETEAEEVPFRQNVTVNGVEVSVSAEAGVFPADARLDVRTVSRMPGADS